MGNSLAGCNFGLKCAKKVWNEYRDFRIQDEHEKTTSDLMKPVLDKGT